MRALEIGELDPKTEKHQMFRSQTICVDEHSIDTLKEAIDKAIDEKDVIVIDGWKSYQKAIGERV
jgi:hypothetical protein